MTTLLADLQNLLFSAAVGTVIMTLSTMDGKCPRNKWQTFFPCEFAKEYYCKNDITQNTLAACRSYENSKEWLQLSLPLMWTFAIFGEALPYATQNIVSILTFALSAIWFIGNQMYTKGYTADKPEGRATGFKIRTTAFRVWLYGAIAAVTCYSVRHFGLYDLP